MNILENKTYQKLRVNQRHLFAFHPSPVCLTSWVGGGIFSCKLNVTITGWWTLQHTLSIVRCNWVCFHYFQVFVFVCSQHFPGTLELWTAGGKCLLGRGKKATPEKQTLWFISACLHTFLWWFRLFKFKVGLILNRSLANWTCVLIKGWKSARPIRKGYSGFKLRLLNRVKLQSKSDNSYFGIFSKSLRFANDCSIPFIELNETLSINSLCSSWFSPYEFESC